MKKKTVKMITSAVCLAVLLIVYVGIKSLVAEQELKEAEETQQETEIVFSASVDEMSKVTLCDEETELTFVKEGDLWIYEEDRNFPVDQDTVTNTFASLTSIEADVVIENPEDLSEYELEEPNASIVVSTEEGDTVLWMGMNNESAGQCYIRKGNDTQRVYVVSSILMDSLEKSLYDYAKMDAFPDIKTDTVTRLKVRGENVDYTLKKEQAVWMVSLENEKEEKADSAAAISLVSSLANIEYASFVNYHSEDDAVYGLDQPYAIMEIDYQEEITLEATPSEGEETFTEATVAEGQPSDMSETSEEETVLEDRTMVVWIGNEAEADTRYVKLAGSDQIYTITQDLLNIFLAYK